MSLNQVDGHHPASQSFHWPDDLILNEVQRFERTFGNQAVMQAERGMQVYAVGTRDRLYWENVRDRLRYRQYQVSIGTLAQCINCDQPAEEDLTGYGLLPRCARCQTAYSESVNTR